MERCIVLVTDDNYVPYTKYLISFIRVKGNWKEDICVIGNGLSQLNKNEFLSKNIKLFEIPKVYPYFAKYYLFDEYFKHWDRLCYFDADFIILKDLNELFDRNNNHNIYCDIEPFTINQYFKESNNPEMFKELGEIYNITRSGYNTGCILYNSSLINKNTVKDLFELTEKYREINEHTGLKQGGDQPILNLYFIKEIKELSGVSYIAFAKPNDIALHTCRWNAPWVRFKEMYEYYLNCWQAI